MTTLSEAAAAIRAGKLRPSQLLENCLTRIEQTESHLHAWSYLDRAGAARAAKSLDRELDAGASRGPLHGIPVGVKDIIDVAGLPTQAGSPLRASHIAGEDAPVVSRLRAAGAIILGKTVTTQFACFDPPETANPHDTSRTPGGSSSGSAVSVATGTCLAALGSQTGGSIIRPAAYCGVVGFKPSKGRWSTGGVIPVSELLDHVGPFTTSARDLWPMWEAVVGSTETAASEASSRQPPRRWGMVPHFFHSVADSRVAGLVEAAANQLLPPDAELERVSPPVEWEEAAVMHRRIMARELADYHADLFARHPDQYAPHISQLIRDGLAVSGTHYQTALQHRLKFITAMQRAFDQGPNIWITPATPAPAPGRETTGDPSCNTPWSYCGFPTVSIPCGTLNGLPVSLQLIAAAGQDESLLRVAAAAEKRLQQ